MAVCSLAAGIGATTAVFSFVRAIVLEKLHVPGPDRLVILRQHYEMFHIENCCFPWQVFHDLRRQDPDFEDMLAVADRDIKLSDDTGTEKLRAELVSGNYFRMLGVHAAAGRLIEDAEDSVEGGPAIAVIGYRLWQDRYGGRADVIGRKVLIDNRPFQIVGVSQAGFRGLSLHDPSDLRIPASMTAVLDGEKSLNSYAWAKLVGRLKPGVTPRDAQPRADGIGRRSQKQLGFTMGEHDTIYLTDGSQGLNSKKEQFAKPVLVVFLLVTVVLLIACANLAALLMVRATGSSREAGIRAALGAGRLSLIVRFMTESLLLAGVGCAAGWVIAMLLTTGLSKLLGEANNGLISNVRPDFALLAFSIALSLASCLLFGLLPAWRASQARPIETMRRSPAGGFGKASILSRGLIALQVALSLALLFGAGLFARTLHNLRSIDLGFRPENLVLVHVDVSGTPRAAAPEPFFEDLLSRATAMNGTRAASLAGLSVLSGSMASMGLQIPGYQAPDHLMPVTYFTKISEGYFRTLGIPLLAGRDFNAGDRQPDQTSVIVNRQFERRFLGGSALGKSFAHFGQNARVVGIAGDAKFRWLREEAQPVMYLPVAQEAFPQNLFLQVRTADDTHAAAERVRSIVREIDPRVPVDTVRTMAMQLDEALARERLLAFLSSLIGLLAVTLAAIGLYGVLAFTVVRRTREIGIRMAVGADRRRIVRLFLIEGAWISGAGVAAGIPLALLLGRLSSSLLYGLVAQDLPSVAGSAAVLMMAALVAAVIPAWRAARLDPLTALRHE